MSGMSDEFEISATPEDDDVVIAELPPKIIISANVRSANAINNQSPPRAAKKHRMLFLHSDQGS